MTMSLAGLAAIAPPASAAPWTGQVATTSSFGYGGAGCSPSNTGASPATPLPSNTPLPLNHSGSATGTGPTAPDTGSMSASVIGSAQVSESAGSLAVFDVTASLKATASRALGGGSACSASSVAAVNLTGSFSTASPGLLDLDFSSLGSGFGQHTLTLVRVAPTPPSGALPIMYNMTGTTHHLLAVQAGDWSFTTTMSATALSNNSVGQPPPSADLRVKLHGEFKPFGLADGAATGAGKKYVALPESQTCASHSVTADFTKKAGKKAKKGKKPVIKKATFFVNGAKVRSVKKPHKNTLVTLTGLPVDENVEVSARLKLQAKGKGTVTVERTYLPCS